MIGYNRTRFLLARWSIFAILIAIYMLVFFHRMAPAVISADLMKAFNTSGAALGSLAAMYFYIYTAMQIPAGVLADTLGARVTVSAGTLVAGCGSILFGLAGTFAGASVGRALVGLGVSVVFVGLFKSNSVWFSERNFGMISGLTLLLGNIGAIASAGPLAGLLRSYSWRSVFMALGVVSLLLAVVSALVVRNRPEDMGFPSMRQMDGKTSHPASQRHWWHDLKSVVGTGSAWPVLWVDLGMVGSMLAFVGLWAIPFLRDVHGLGRSAAAQYTTAALAGFAVGSMLAGWSLCQFPPDLLDWLENVEQLVVCDACRGLGDYGRISRYEWPVHELSEISMSGTHDFSLPAALALAERLGRLPRRVVIWVVEGSTAGVTETLSPAVAAAIPQLVQHMAEDIA